VSQAVAERNQACSLLADEYSLGANSGFDEVQRADRCSLIQDMIGDGYHFVESVRSSNRTFKRHKALAIAQIKRIAGPDNSESAHGKDRCDSECGRQKYILRCHEMRHTPEEPTMLQTSYAQYLHLYENHCVTRRTLRQKKGKGTYFRIYHWMPPKSIRPLSTFAEVHVCNYSHQ